MPPDDDVPLSYVRSVPLPGRVSIPGAVREFRPEFSKPGDDSLDIVVPCVFLQDIGPGLGTHGFSEVRIAEEAPQRLAKGGEITGLEQESVSAVVDHHGNRLRAWSYHRNALSHVLEKLDG